MVAISTDFARSWVRIGADSAVCSCAGYLTAVDANLSCAEREGGSVRLLELTADVVSIVAKSAFFVRTAQSAIFDSA